jgi:hypothetical protein
MGVHAKRVIRAVTLVALAFAALAGRTQDARAFGPVFDCPTPREATFQMLMDLWQMPQPDRFLAFGANKRGLDCFGDATLGFEAVVGRSEGRGGLAAYTVEPAWLDPWLGSRWLAATDIETVPGFSDEPLMQVRVEPDLRDRFDALSREWVWVGAKFDHPAAEDCRVAGKIDPSVETPSREELVEACRAALVVTDVRPLQSPCPDGLIDLTAIASTPGHLRAYCFGSRPVDFEARGGTVAIAWDLQMPEFGLDWQLINAKRNDGVLLHAFVGELVVSPPDAPEDGGDGDGGLDSLWRVTGHFDDPRSAECAPGTGSIWANTGEFTRWSPEDAVAFCRNSLIVDRLGYLHPASVPAASPIPPPAPSPRATLVPPTAPPPPSPSASLPASPWAPSEATRPPAETGGVTSSPSASEMPTPSPASSGSRIAAVSIVLLVLGTVGGGLALAARRRRRPTDPPGP